ncbi:hypothetical protein vseg_017466 [Gypsophila vaccaria]
MSLYPDKIISMKSLENHKYLRLENGPVQTYGLLHFSSDDVFDAYAQLVVVRSSFSNDFFHLKCTYNGKYLVRWGPDSNWLSASANSPIEDQNSWACTLFRPIFVSFDGLNKNLRLKHVQLGHYASYGVAPFNSYLYAGSDIPDPESKRDVFTVVEWAPTVSFTEPRKVAFKGDANGKFLGSTMVNDKPLVHFSFDKADDPKVEHEVIPSEDGLISIKSNYLGMFWRRDPDDFDKIVADLRDDPRVTNNQFGLFRYCVVGMNRIGLFNISKAQYCKMDTSGETGNDNLLVVATPNVDQWAPLEVIDLPK